MRCAWRSPRTRAPIARGTSSWWDTAGRRRCRGRSGSCTRYGNPAAPRPRANRSSSRPICGCAVRRRASSGRKHATRGSPRCPRRKTACSTRWTGPPSPPCGPGCAPCRATRRRNKISPMRLASPSTCRPACASSSTATTGRRCFWRRDRPRGFCGCASSRGRRPRTPTRRARVWRVSSVRTNAPSPWRSRSCHPTSWSARRGSCTAAGRTAP